MQSLNCYWVALFVALPLTHSNSFKVYAVIYNFFRGGGEVARKGSPYNGLYGESPPEMGTFNQASGIWKGGDFTSESI